RTTVLSCVFRPQYDPHARETPPLGRGPLTEGPECNLQATDAVRSLLVLDKDRTLVGPLHNAFLSRVSTPRDAQLNRAFQAKEPGGSTGQEGEPPLNKRAANRDIIHHLIVEMDEVIEGIVAHFGRNGRWIAEERFAVLHHIPQGVTE